MDQMEAFTEIMLRRFYPAWPGVSPPFLKNSCLAFPEKRVLGSCMLMEPFCHSTHLPQTWLSFPSGSGTRRTSAEGGPVLAGFFGKQCDADAPPQLRPSHPTPGAGQREPQPLWHAPCLYLPGQGAPGSGALKITRPHSDSYHCLPQNAKFVSLNFLPNPF